jgi:hypothetical protein
MQVDEMIVAGERAGAGGSFVGERHEPHVCSCF